MTTDADDRGLEQLRTRRDALDAAITQMEAEQAAAERAARKQDEQNEVKEWRERLRQVARTP